MSIKLGDDEILKTLIKDKCNTYLSPKKEVKCFETIKGLQWDIIGERTLYVLEQRNWSGAETAAELCVMHPNVPFQDGRDYCFKTNFIKLGCDLIQNTINKKYCEDALNRGE